MASEQIGILSIISLISINIFIIYKRNIQRDSTKFLILLNIALLFFIAGWLALYLSPGHAKRASLAVFDGIYMSLSQILSLDFMQLMKRIAKTMMAFKNNILLFFSIPLIYFLCIKKVNVKNIAIFAILTIIVLVLNNNFKIAGVRAFWILHIFVLFIALFILAKRELSSQTRQNGYFYVALLLLFLAFCMCMASTIQFISLPHRARLGDSMILIAMVALLFDRFANKHFQRLIVAICLAYGVFVTFAFIEYRIKWDRMLDFVEKQKQSGETHIVIDDIFHSRYKNLMNWGNPGKEPNEWPNTTYAQYFGVESFSVKSSDK